MSSVLWGILRSALCLLLSALFLPAYADAGRGDCWIFQHDLQHTGLSTIKGPSAGTLKWSYTTGGVIDHCLPSSARTGRSMSGRRMIISMPLPITHVRHFEVEI